MFECLQNLIQFAAFSGRVLLERQRSLLGACVNEVSLLAGRPHVILVDFTPEHDPPVLSRHTSLDFLNEEEKTVLGLAADLC